MKLVPLILVCIVLASGCASKPTTPTPVVNNSTPKAAPMPVALAVSLIDQQVPPGAGVPPTTMGIDPSTLTLTVGVPVNLTVTNKGNTNHNLVIDGLDVKTDNIAPGASQSVVFTPTKAGTYKMYCAIGSGSPLSHDAQGMHGEVTVK